MLTAEITKTFKSAKSIIVFIIMNFLGVAASLEAAFRGATTGNHPTMVSLLANGTWTQYRNIYIWFMPVFLILAYCEKYITERKKGIVNVYLSKTNKKKFFFSKILSSFIISAIFSGVPLLINLGMNIVLMHNGTGFLGLEEYSKEALGEYLYNSMQHPYLSWFLYFISFVLVMGLLGTMCEAFCFIFRDSKLAYIVSLALWMINFATPAICINDAIQPLQPESTIENALIGYMYYLPMVFIPIIIAYISIVVKKDEL